MFGPNMPKACSRGVTGFDKEIGVCLRGASAEVALKPSKHSSANKVARAVLSPIQLADLQPAYALVA